MTNIKLSKIINIVFGALWGVSIVNTIIHRLSLFNTLFAILINTVVYGTAYMLVLFIFRNKIK